MDTIPGISKNAAKKWCQCENHAAANSLILATTANTNPPAIISLNASTATTTMANNLECPNKAIKDLWRLVAKHAARKAWQCNYIEEQAWLKATAI